MEMQIIGEFRSLVVYYRMSVTSDLSKLTVVI
jgi:hypothetical protein